MAYAPGISLGPPIYHQRTSAAWKLNQAAVAGTWYTVTYTGFPVGARALSVFAMIIGIGTADVSLIWRPYNNGDTVANSLHRTIGYARLLNETQGSIVHVVIDSAGRVDFGVTGGNAQILGGDWVDYYMGG